MVNVTLGYLTISLSPISLFLVLHFILFFVYFVHIKYTLPYREFLVYWSKCSHNGGCTTDFCQTFN